MISIFRRGRIFWARGSVNGRRIRPQSLDTQFKPFAEARARHLEFETAGLGPREIPWPRFQQEFLAWAAPQQLRPSTMVKYRFVLARFGRFLEGRGRAALSAVNSALIAEYSLDRRGHVHPTRRTPLGDGGLKADLPILRRALGYARDAGYLSGPPVRFGRLNSPPKGTQPFGADEVARPPIACRAPGRTSRRSS
jgi:hypothetical protein